jgi:hypothetical protein
LRPCIWRKAITITALWTCFWKNRIEVCHVGIIFAGSIEHSPPSFCATIRFFAAAVNSVELHDYFGFLNQKLTLASIRCIGRTITWKLYAHSAPAIFVKPFASLPGLSCIPISLLAAHCFMPLVDLFDSSPVFDMRQGSLLVKYNLFEEPKRT